MRLDFNKLLLVSCHFPPVGGIQVQRALSLARYLPSEGFSVHVLTVRTPRVPTLDAALLDWIPSEVQVHRARTLEPPFYLRKRIWSRIGASAPHAGDRPQKPPAFFRRMASAAVERALCPDPQILWVPAARLKARRLVRRQRIGNILVTAPPFSAFLIGNRLKQEFPSVRFITDYRDEWLDYYVHTYGFRDSQFVRQRAAEIERCTVSLSDRIVAATPRARDTIRRRYPGQPDEKFCLVPNGFDEEAFSAFTSRPHGGQKIVVVYTGTIYEPASPVLFLDALDQLPPNLRVRFETRFIGRMSEEFDRRVLENRKSEIHVLPFVPHSEALRHMEEADLLLLPWNDVLNVPGKCYEYMATRKPILALTRRNTDLAELIERASCGWVFDPDEQPALMRFLADLAADRGRIATRPNSGEIQNYTRKRLASLYASVIKEAGPVGEDELGRARWVTTAN
jgi:glycosyltransferase involved in cell wall biosynthesis